MSSVRRATVEDVPRLVELARRRYNAYGLEKAAEWATKLISSPYGAIFFSGDSAVVVAWTIEFWRPNERVADIVEMYGPEIVTNPWDTFKALKAAIAWAKEQGCYAVRFGTVDGAQAKGPRGIDVLAPFAKRLRAKPFGVSYILEFKSWENGSHQHYH